MIVRRNSSGKTALFEDLRALHRMVRHLLILLVVEVMQQPDSSPRLLVLAERPRVRAHGRFHGERVGPEALRLRVFVQEVEAFLPCHVRLRDERVG